MSNLPITFQDKENSPELLAYLQQFGEKSYLSAEEINQIRDSINELAQGSLPDAVLKTGTISITGLAVNIAANAFAWRINQQSFLNPPSYGVNLTAAANGFYRADIIVGTSAGTYQVIQGAPSATTAIEPDVPEGTIRLAGVVVFGMVVGQPTPTPMTNFVQKSERANVVLTGSGIINQLDLVDEKATIVFKGSITRLNTISYASVPYNGKRITLFNAQATPVIIGHSVIGYGVDFVFASGQDYILATNETIEFSYDITYAPYAHHRLIGSKGIATWSELQGKPSTFPPSSHTHTVSEITDFPTFKTIENQSIVGAGNIDLNKSDVGLSNVDNTSDANKPLSTAAQTALNGKFNAPIGLTTNYLPKWNGSGFGNSVASDNGTNFHIGSTAFYSNKFGVTYSSADVGNSSADGVVFQTGDGNDYIQFLTKDGQYSAIQAGLRGSSSRRAIAINPLGGNTLFGKTNDAGDGVIQVNGTITASPAVSPNQVVVKSQLDAVVGTSGTFTVSGIQNATYMLVGKILTIYLSASFTGVSGGFIQGSTFTLPNGYISADFLAGRFVGNGSCFNGTSTPLTAWAEEMSNTSLRYNISGTGAVNHKSFITISLRIQ